MNRSRVLADLVPSPGWDAVPAGAVLAPVARTGYPNERLLSVSKYRGVHVREDGDSHSRPSEDLSHYLLTIPGDLVVNIMLAWDRGLGVSTERGLVSPAYATYTVDERRADSRFLDYQVRSEPAIAEWRRRSYGIQPSRWRLYWERMSSAKLLLPDLDTQRRIADMLDAETARIDTLIEKNERVLDLLTVREARVLEDGIYGSGARTVGIHYLATYVNGYPFKPEDRSDEGTPIIRIAQLLGDTRQQDFYAGTPDPYCHIDSGDLIFSWSATLAGRIWDGGPAFLNQHLFRVEPHGGVDRDWLLHALNAAVPRMKSMTHGSTMTHITRPMMTKIRVPKPNLKEQQRIVPSIRVQFDRLAALRAKVDRQQELLRIRRQALITAAVTGQIEV